jgi:hypothetical protein
MPHDPEPPGEVALDRVVLRTAGELVEVAHADGRLWRDLQIEAGVDRRRAPTARRATSNDVPGLRNVSTVDGVTLPNACFQAAESRGVSAMPLANA